MRGKATLWERVDIGFSEGMALGVVYAGGVALFQHVAAQLKSQPTQLNLYVMGGALAFAVAQQLIYRIFGWCQPTPTETLTPWLALPDDDGSSYGGVGRWAGITPHPDENNG